MKTIKINDLEIPVVVTKRRNSRRVVMRVKHNTIHVSTPLLMPDFELKNILLKHQDYILKNIETDLDVLNSCHLFGNRYSVNEYQDNKNQVIISGINMYIFYKTDPKKVLYKFYKEQLENYINSIYREATFTFGIVHKPELKYRYLTSRYGSYSRVHNLITLSTMLAKYDYELIESVLYHELAHVLHFDHSRSFYDVLLKAYPNYKEINKKLKKTKYNDKY